MLCLEESIGSISSQIPFGDETGSFPGSDPEGPVLEPLWSGRGSLTLGGEPSTTAYGGGLVLQLL